MKRKLVRPILLAGALAAGGAALWFLGQRWLLESRYQHDSEAAERLIEEGSYAEAIPLLQRSVDAARQLDPKGARLDQALQELAEAHGAQGDYVGSQHLYFASYQSRVEKYGFAHPETADVLFKLGRSYELQGLPEAAEGMYNQAIMAWQQMNRAEDPAVIPPHLGLARVLLTLQRPDEAVVSHAKAIEIQERALGDEDPRLAPLLEAYAGLLESAGRQLDAQQARDRAGRLGAAGSPQAADGGQS
jgi:tetratricopeptide (TPR) repeat protein